MEAGFKMEGSDCFVSEMSRNIYTKEQGGLPKGLQELLVSWWGLHPPHPSAVGFRLGRA